MLNLNEIKRLDETRNKIASDIEAFLARGGAVRQFDTTVNSENNLRFGKRNEQYEASIKRSGGKNAVNFSDDTVRSIIADKESGLVIKQLAYKYKCAQSTIYKVLKEFKGGS